RDSKGRMTKGLLELDDLVRAGETHFDESRLAQGTAHLHGPVKRRRAVRAVASSAGTVGAVGLGAMAGYGLSAVEDPVAPPAKYATEAPWAHKTLEQLLLTGVPWTDGAEGQRFAWCTRVGAESEFIFLDVACEHRVLPETE